MSDDTELLGLNAMSRAIGQLEGKVGGMNDQMAVFGKDLADIKTAVLSRPCQKDGEIKELKEATEKNTTDRENRMGRLSFIGRTAKIADKLTILVLLAISLLLGKIGCEIKRNGFHVVTKDKPIIEETETGEKE